MQYDAHKLGQLIAEERRKRGMSQENLSAFAGLARSHLAKIEGGGVDIKLKTLWRICEVLEINPSSLVARAEEG